MKRLTVNITGAERKKVDGKLKTFSTLSFVLKNDSEIDSKISELKSNGVDIVKQSCIFI